MGVTELLNQIAYIHPVIITPVKNRQVLQKQNCKSY